MQSTDDSNAGGHDIDPMKIPLPVQSLALGCGGIALGVVGAVALCVGVTILWIERGAATEDRAFRESAEATTLVVVGREIGMRPGGAADDPRDVVFAIQGVAPHEIPQAIPPAVPPAIPEAIPQARADGIASPVTVPVSSSVYGAVAEGDTVSVLRSGDSYRHESDLRDGETRGPGWLALGLGGIATICAVTLFLIGWLSANRAIRRACET